MAITKTDHQFAEDARVPFAFGGSGKGRVKVTSEWTAAELVIDSQQSIFKAAKDCVISNVVVEADDLDTNGTPLLTIDVGTAADDNLYVAASVAGQAGVTSTVNVAADGGLLGAGLDVIVSILAAAATAAAGTITVSFDVTLVD